MKHMPWITMLCLAAACASSGAGARSSAGAGQGTGAAHPPPVIMYRVQDLNSPHPTIRIPYDTAYQLGVPQSAFASPAMIDQLEAACAQSNQPVQCRREIRVCREKTCRVVAEY